MTHIEPPFGPRSRRTSVGVRVGDGEKAVIVGGGAPVVVQSMTNTDTADIEATARQIAALTRAGSELVRITVDRDEAAAAVPHIRDRLVAMGVTAPLIGDFHYIGHKLLADHPACAEALDKYRINPGNVGFKDEARSPVRQDRRDRHPQRQGGAHRRQLGIARPGASDPPDGRKRAQARADRGARSHARGDGPFGADLRGAGRGDRPSALAHHPVGEGFRRAGPDHGLSHAGRAVGLCPPSWPHRSRHGLERDRRLVGGAGRAPPGGSRRHDPHFADPRAGRRPHAGGPGRPGASADDGLSRLRAAGRRLPRLRAHDLDGVPGARARHSEPSRDIDAAVARRFIRASSVSMSR